MINFGYSGVEVNVGVQLVVLAANQTDNLVAKYTDIILSADNGFVPLNEAH